MAQDWFVSDRVRIEMCGHVAHLQLTRAVKMNALDAATFEALIAAGRHLHDAPDVRAVVLSSSGRAFCAGIDVISLSSKKERERTIANLAVRNLQDMNIAQWAVMQWRQLPVPVIAAVHDVAFGAGFQLALGADVRFATASARMSVMEVQWGLVPDMGGMYLLRELVRRDVAAELIASGRIFTGDEAQRLGLVTRVCDDPIGEALTFARQIAGRSPDAIRGGKRLLSLHDDALRNRILRGEGSEQMTLLRSASHEEAVRAERAGEVPRFGRAEPPPVY